MKDLKKLGEYNQRFALYAIINHHAPHIIEWRAEGSQCSLCDCSFKDTKKFPDMNSKHYSAGREKFAHGYPVVCWDCWEEALDEQDKAMSVPSKEGYQRAEMETFYSIDKKKKLSKKGKTKK